MPHYRVLTPGKGREPLTLGPADRIQRPCAKLLRVYREKLLEVEPGTYAPIARIELCPGLEFTSSRRLGPDQADIIEE